MPDTPGTPKDAVLTELKDLAKLYRGRAQLSLIGLVGAFLTSLMLFFFANAIGLENDQGDEMQQLRDSMQKQLSETSEALAGKLAQFDQYFASQATEAPSLDLPPGVPSRTALVSQINSLESLKANLSEQLRVFREQQILKTSPQVQSQLVQDVISVSITRVGAVMLAIFMMQILVGFYRYFARLSNYYESKIVAVHSLADSETTELRDIVNSLRPEEITFGQQPPMPFEKILEIVKLAKQ